VISFIFKAFVTAVASALKAAFFAIKALINDNIIINGVKRV
jgi:hypothetical protein